MTELSDLYGGLITRTATIEEFDPDESTILVRAAPYEVETELTPGLFERFARGTFESATAAPHRVKLWLGHSTAAGTPVGVGRTVEERRDGLYVRAKIANTAAGHDARELANDGVLDEVSVEFTSHPDWYTARRRADGVHVTHTRGRLLGVALVPHGAYADNARVLEVRSLVVQPDPRMTAIARLNALTS
jgi:Escherichia/Staphylococcus phage prohead protease